MAKQTVIALSPEARAALTKRYADSGRTFNADTYVKGARVLGEDMAQITSEAPVESRVDMYRTLVAKTGLSQGEEDLKVTLEMYDSVEGYREKADRLAYKELADMRAAALDARRGALDARRGGRLDAVEAYVFPERGPLKSTRQSRTPAGARPAPGADYAGLKERAAGIDQLTGEYNQLNATTAGAPLPVSPELRKAFAKQDREQGFASFGVAKPFSKNPIAQEGQLSYLMLNKALGGLTSRFSARLSPGQ